MAKRFEKITVVQGGNSSEREVSLRTAAAVSKALGSLGYQVQTFDPKLNAYAELAALKPQVAFLAMHGREGEDGRIQGLLECLKVPYTGSGVMTSSLCYDKLRTKIFVKHYGVLTPDYLVFKAGENAADWAAGKNILLPAIVKPSREGSTVGMTIVRKPEELTAALEKAAGFCNEVLIETFITGQEITVGVLNGQALPIIEIAPKSGFYDYESKYTPGRTEYILPARIAPEITQQVSELSVNIFNWLGCRGAARADYIVDGRGNAWFLEINTIPGMTETSLLPKAAQAAGIDFAGLCEKILNTAGLDN
jgi:D-alanine-D-alanine ligase